MVNEKTEIKRKLLLDLLKGLVDVASQVEGEMEDVPLSQGLAQMVLKPYKEDHITCGKTGFNAVYRADDGNLYEISIRKIEKRIKSPV